MRKISFDELRKKEVINTRDCRRLGYISDLCIDLECGKVVSFTVKDSQGFIPCKCEEVCVEWENVTKIGDDIIFVDICYTCPEKPPKPEKKKLFGI